jgi:peptidoglycan/LPS O-acetylase OafA/YrhL
VSPSGASRHFAATRNLVVTGGIAGSGEASARPIYGFTTYEAGECGVWIFWCISGFIFSWKYRDTISGRSVGGRTFFVFRLSRLYPLHLVTLVPLYDDLFFASFVTVTLLASYLTYRYFEAPAQTLIRSHLSSNQGRSLEQLQSHL